MPSNQEPWRARFARWLVQRALANPKLLQQIPERWRSRFRRRVRGAMFDGVPVEKLSGSQIQGEDGVDLYGLLDHPSGVGEQARAIVRSLRAVGVPLTCHPFTPDQLAGKHPFHFAPARHRVQLCVVNAENALYFLERARHDRFRGRFNIAYWAWELEDFPEVWQTVAEAFDEIWVLSEFTRRAIAAKTKVPVQVLPGGIALSPTIPADRSRFGLPLGSPVVLSMADFDSFEERKNPWGAIEIVKQLPASERPLFVLKTSGEPVDRHRLQSQIDAIGGCWISSRLDRPELEALLMSCDILLSPHRSEGFGLVLAEAMALGKVVIATDYSGNRDFMTSENSLLIHSQMIRLKTSIGPYPAGACWAEPDLLHGAQLLRQVLQDSEMAARLAKAARETIAKNYSPEVTGERMKQRLAEVG